LRRRLAIGAGIVCLAAVAVVIAALSEAGSAHGTPISAPGRWGPALDAALAVGFAAYVVGLVLLSRTTVPAWPVLAIVVAIQLTPLAGPLLFSQDAVVYNALGTISDPYTPRPTLAGGETYGPLWTLVSRPLARADGGLSDSSAYAFRILAAACVLVIVALVWRLASRKVLAAALVGWNPAIAFHFAGGGHSDALMMVFVLGALVLASIQRPQAAGVSWATAMALKWTAIWFFALWAIERARKRRPVGLAGLLLAGAVLLVLAFSIFGTDWLKALSNLSRAERADHPSLGTLGWLEDMGIPRVPAIELGVVIQVVVFAVFALTAWRRRLHLGLAAGVLIITAPRIDPWYILWPISLSAADDEDRWGRVLAVALSGFLLSDVVSTFVDA
jgi:Glycosyltransferase family 87